MARRNLLDNTAGADFLRKLSARPLADRASGAAGGFAGQRHDAAYLFGGNPRWMPRPGGICQACGNTHVLQPAPLEAEPTLPPETDGIDVDTHTARNLGIVVSLGRCQDNLCPHGELLGGGMPSGQGIQRVPFVGRQRHEWWLWATHSGHSPRRRSMSRLHDAVGPLYHRNIRAQLY